MGYGMTSQAVVDLVQAKWAASLDEDLPYYDSINTEPDPAPLPDLWGSLSFPESSEDKISIGDSLSLYRERGTVTIVIANRAGAGRSAIQAAAEACRTAFRTYVSDDGMMRITSVSPVRFSSGDSVYGTFFLSFVDLAYSYDFYQ